MITLTHRSHSMLSTKNVNKHKNMLILAPGGTDYRINEIMYYESVDAVRSLYGESELTDAFVLAKNLGVQYIFVANVKSQYDYIEMVDVIRQYDFTYIVPIGITFSDHFFNPILNRIQTYTEFYLESIGSVSSSVMVFTDQHASLYEDLDHFLSDMRDKIVGFKTVSQKSLQNGRRLMLVANNLVDHPYANVLAAAALITTDYATYPTAEFGKAIFTIDDFDVGSLELAYFRNNALTATTIENLKNFRLEQDAAKIVPIDKVITFIEREIDFSSFQGKLFTEYTKLKIYQLLKSFLDGIGGVAIRSYTIKSVEFVQTESSAGTILNTFSIGPINSLEEFDIAMEV